jgi:large subunit ribosomal protein L30
MDAKKTTKKTVKKTTKAPKADKANKKTLKVKLVKSAIGCNPKQRATVKGLGLTRMNKVVTLEDTACVRGMINKIIHMVEVEL